MYNVTLITLTFFCSFFIVFSSAMVIFMIVVLVCCKTPKKTKVKMRSRNELSDRRVNDFIRSVLIDDDCQYDLLKRDPKDHNNSYDIISSMIADTTTYTRQDTYDYADPKAYYYDPKKK